MQFAFEHLRQLETILTSNKTAVPILIEGRKLVVVRPQGLMKFDHVKVADVMSAAGDRMLVVLEAMLPLPGLGAGRWPDEQARAALEVVQDAAIKADL